MYCDNRAKFSMVTTRIACAKCISLMGVTSHDVGSFQSCSVSNIYDTRPLLLASERSERSPTLIGQNGNSRYLYVTYVTQNAHALTHAHEIAIKQRHNKQSFSLSLKLKHYCSEYYGTQRTRKQAKEGPRTPSRN